jgi:hypothetical protein
MSKIRFFFLELCFRLWDSVPSRRDGIELVEEEHAGSRRVRPREEIPHLKDNINNYTQSLRIIIDIVNCQGKEKKKKAYGHLRGADVLVQQLRSLHRDEVQSALLRDRARE